MSDAGGDRADLSEPRVEPVSGVEASVIDESFPDLVSRVVEDAKALGRAELAVLRAKARVRAVAYRNAAILFAVAVALALCAAVALSVGAVLTLATLVGPGWATLIVVAVLLGLAGLLGWLGARQAQTPGMEGADDGFE